MRIIALDVGEKRIGVAVTDRLKKISYPLTTIENDTLAGPRISKILKEYDVEKIIVGIPYNLKGEEGYQTIQVKEFIVKNLKDSGVPIIYFDERFTTKISLKNLKKGNNVQGNKKNGEADRIAASLLLNDYLTKVESEKV
jgi:putative holliday junction resolvase